MNRAITSLKGTGIFFAAITLMVLLLPPAARGEKTALLETIEAEILRTMKEMKLPESPFPYFASCSLTLLKTVSASAAMGSIVSAKDYKYARINVSIRVGDYRLDNTNFTPKRTYGGHSEIGAAMLVPIRRPIFRRSDILDFLL